jgi:selenide,water dikinase
MRILCDPQTSGGLMIAVSAESAEKLAAGLSSRGVLAARIGRCVADTPGRVTIR